MADDAATRLARMEATLEGLREQIGQVVQSISVLTKVQTDHAIVQEHVRRLDQQITLLEAKNSNLEISHQKLEKKTSVYIAMVSGTMAGVTAVFAVLGWVLGNNIVAALRAAAAAVGSH